MFTPFEHWVENAPNHHFVYHWEEKTSSCIRDGVVDEIDFYFTDNPTSWSSPWMPADHAELLVVEVFVFNPMIITGMNDCYERHSRRLKKEALQKGNDSIIYIPPPNRPEERQGVLFDSRNQIKNISSYNAWRF
tara:strand:+ start:280 stop:681 length:402 start_codon:yes stop_codon:yes gene_type:complete